MNDSPTRPRVALLVGSLRADSLNRKIAESVAELTRDSLDCEIIPISDLPLYNEELEECVPEPWARFRSRIAGATGVIFLTPEYNRGVPGALKNAIDVASRPAGASVWSGKPAAVISASPGAIGGFGANHQLRQLCVFLDMPVMQQPEAYLGNVSQAQFGPGGQLTDEALRSLLSRICEAYGAWIRRFTASGSR